MIPAILIDGQNGPVFVGFQRVGSTGFGPASVAGWTEGCRAEIGAGRSAPAHHFRRENPVVELTINPARHVGCRSATARLQGVLDFLRLDGDGKQKSSWETTLLRANGVEPTYVGGKRGGHSLTNECHAALKRIDLHWHDLRHEYASRLVEKGVPLSQVGDLLGHASITTTERYDNSAAARVA